MATPVHDDADAVRKPWRTRVGAAARRLPGIAASIGTLVFAVAVGTVLVLGGYVAAESASRSHIAILRYGGLTVLTVVLGVLISCILTAKGRAHMAKKMVTVGWYGLPVFSGFLFFLAVGDFSAVTLELVRHHAVTLQPRPQDVGQVADFYSWQFINALPGGLAGTMHWRAPLAYDEQRVGAIIVLFNLTIIAPILACLRAIHVHKRGDKDQAAAS